jgi:DNA-binding MarR family transcriptional regulator
MTSHIAPQHSNENQAVPEPILPNASLLAIARRAREARAHFNRFFPRDILRDSAWDMMLELIIAQEEGAKLCVKQLVLASGESSTSAMRRIDRLQSVGLLRRVVDDRDHRRVWIELTRDGHAAMSLMLQHLSDSTQTTGAVAQAVPFKPRGL